MFIFKARLRKLGQMGPPRPTFGAVTPDDAMDMMFRTQIIQRMAPQGAKRILFSVGVDPSLELDKPLKDPQKPESNISNVKTAGRVADGRPSCAEDGALGRPESPAVLVGSVTVEPNAAVENPTGLLISDGQLPPKIAGRAGSSVGSVISPPLGTLSPPTPGQPGPSKQQSSSVNGLQNSETSEKPNSKPPLPENHELPSAASSAQRAVPKSWADRLKTSGPKPGISKAGPLSATQSPVKPAVEILRTFVPLSAMKPPDIQPRGLVNNGNM